MQTSQGKLYEVCGILTSLIAQPKVLKCIWQRIWPTREQRRHIGVV